MGCALLENGVWTMCGNVRPAPEFGHNSRVNHINMLMPVSISMLRKLAWLKVLLAKIQT